MKCQAPGCGGRVHVTHSYAVQDRQFSRRVCRECGTVHRCDSVILLVRGRGGGAKAAAARYKAGLKCKNPSPSRSPF
jgi:hypothetical protein